MHLTLFALTTKIAVGYSRSAPIHPTRDMRHIYDASTHMTHGQSDTNSKNDPMGVVLRVMA